MCKRSIFTKRGDWVSGKTSRPKNDVKAVDDAIGKIGIEIVNVRGIYNILIFPFVSIGFFTVQTPPEVVPLAHTTGWIFFYGAIFWATAYYLYCRRIIRTAWSGAGGILLVLWLIAGSIAIISAISTKTMILSDQSFWTGGIIVTVLLVAISYFLTKNIPTENNL